MKQILFLIISLNSFVVGQTIQQSEQIRQEIRARDRKDKVFKRLKNVEIKEIGEIDLSSFKLSKKDKQMIEPAKTDVALYSSSLRLPETKIIKIINVSCMEFGVVELGEACKSGILGFGNYYSFRQKQHLFPTLSDIRLYKGWIVSSGFLTQGIIVSLGKDTFDSVSLSHSAVRFLNEFNPAETATEADEQKKQIENGIKHEGFNYNSRVQVEVDNVYAMRSIAYKSDIKLPYLDRREDIIVVFKIIRQDAEGNLTLIWRKLQSKEAIRLDAEK